MDFKSLTEGVNFGQIETSTVEEALKSWGTLLVSGLVFLSLAAIGLPFLVLGLITRAIKALINQIKSQKNETINN